MAAVSRSLERRKEVFRPGIPEAKEADEAYEAAYDRASEAWTRARGTPATTQAGLFAKLRATIRFMADLEVDELYEAEWDAIKGDVQRIAGESVVRTVTHSPVDLRDQWDRLRLDLEALNRKHEQLSVSEYGGRFDDIVQALGDIETAIQHAPANDWQTVLVKLHVAVGLAQDQVGKVDKHDHPFVELLRTVTRDVGHLAGGMPS